MKHFIVTNIIMAIYLNGLSKHVNCYMLYKSFINCLVLKDPLVQEFPWDKP